jgi:transposase
MKIIEQDTIDIIKAHINERPRYKLAQRMGVSVKFLYKILHDCNCKIEHKRPVQKPNKKRDEQIAKLYTNHSVKEIAEIIGCHPSTVGKAAKRLKLTHSNETIERLKKNSLANLKKAYEKTTISKRVKSWQRTMQIEKFRVISCIPQQTRFKFADMPIKAYHAKYNLITKHGYFAFEGEPYTIGYDRNTHRMNEEYYKNKYGFSFEEDEECQED